MFINQAAFWEHSLVNGPGVRAVIWMQGCPIRCKGCFNTEMWPFESKMLVKVDELAGRILNIDGIEGVTFSGGEPFAQADALGVLGENLKEHGLNIVTFTGYTLKYLQGAKRPDWLRLLAVTDLLIDGPFIPELRCNLPLRGSTNQRLIFITDRLRDHPDLSEEIAHATEFIIQPDGTIAITGFPDSEIIDIDSLSQPKQIQR
ncbi:radical SAM protein [bacterium]|nr:radical SAM protein [bacterium]